MFRKIIKGLKDVWCGTLEFDTEPKKGSFNPVTSGGVYEAINGAGGAKEIVYFDVDPSDPPSGIYEAIGEALANNKEPVIKNDGAVYFYSSTGTDKYIFVGGYDTDVVNYTTVTVSDNDSVVKETVDTIEGMVFPLYYHSENEQFTVADKTGHALTKTEIADAYRAGQIFMFSSYPASNTQAHWGYCCDIDIDSDNTGYAEFFILAAFGGDSYEWEKYRINLSSGTEFVTLWGPNTSYSTGYSGYYADGATTVSVSTTQNFNATQKARGRDNIGAASASDVTALQSQVSSLSDVSAYSVKGEATVAQLNAGPSGIQAGWAYQLTDSGTLTDGSLAVVAGDTVAWDGTKWFPLVRSDYYATKTYAQNVAHSIAPEYNGTTGAVTGRLYMHEGVLYKCKENCSGAWDSSKFEVKAAIASFELEEKIGTYRLNDMTTPQLLQNFETTVGQTNTARYRARDTVPQAKRKSGLILSYRLDGKPVSEYILHSSSGYINIFRKDQYWFELGGKHILKNASAYYYNDNAVAIDNYLKDVVCSENLDLRLMFSISSVKVINCFVANFVNGVFSKFVGKIENLTITSDRETLSNNERIAMTKYRTSDPDVTVILDTLRISQEAIDTFQIGSTTPSSESLKNSAVVVSVVNTGNSAVARDFQSVFSAVASHSKGLCSVGGVAGVVLDDNVSIPQYSDSFVAETINNAFSVSLNGMNKVPLLKNVKLVRQKYNDIMLYVTTCSRDRVYLSYAPRKSAYENLTEYESQDMFYLEKDNLDELVRIAFPQYMTGGQTNVVGRKHGFFELSNGDALVEVENGTQVNSLLRHINLYKISGFRSKPVVDGVVTIDNNDLSIVCTFVNNANLTSFNSFEEYENGKIIMAPYGSGKTARVYASSDYGDTFTLIFCGDTENQDSIPAKAAVTGDGTGAWPTADHLLGDTIDWTKTLNGNIHVHGIAYDKYYDRIWVVTGDGVQGADSVTGIWWTDDLGTTWHKYGCRKAQHPFNAHGTQMINIIPLPKCVLFATDGEGDGFYRYNRNGKNGNFSIEGCYQFRGVYAQLKSLGGKYCIGSDGVVYQLWHPNDANEESFVGGIVASSNGYDFEHIYTDQFATPGDASTAEISWNCIIADFGDKIVIGAKHGGYIVAYK